MPVKRASDSRHYPPLSETILQTGPGRRTAIVFLMLMAIAGFLAMGLLFYFQMLALFFNHDFMTIHRPETGIYLLSYAFDLAIFTLCLCQASSRRRSSRLPRITFALIGVASVIYGWGSVVAGIQPGDLPVVLVFCGIHSGIQILTAGALLALRRIPWSVAPLHAG